MKQDPSDMPRIPTALYVAALTPTLVGVALLAVELLSEAALPFEATPALALGIVLTTSFALLVAGLRSWVGAAGTGDRGSAALQEAIASLSQAQRLADEQRAAVARIEKALEREGPMAAAPRRPLAFVALLALVLAGAAATGAYFAASTPEGLASENPVHLHAAYALYVDDERLRSKDSAFDVASRGYMRAHLHAPDDEIIHVEGPPGTTLADFLSRTLGLRLAAAGEAPDDASPAERRIGLENRSVRVYVAHEGEGWSTAPEGTSYAPRDHDRILIVIGGTEVEDREKQATVATTFPTS